MSENPITVLSAEEAVEKLKSSTFGRLAIRHDDDIDIFPVNFRFHEGAIFFRTAEGAKLSGLMMNPVVAFETDQVKGEQAWSVLVKGEARRLEKSEEIHEAETIGLAPWVPTLKYNWVKITPSTIEGRTFQLGEEPARY